MSKAVVQAALSRLKYPWLLRLALAALIIDLFIPDPLPFLDEILFAAASAVFANWRIRQAPVATTQTPVLPPPLP